MKINLITLNKGITMKNIFKLCAISLIFSACAAIASAPAQTKAQKAIADINARLEDRVEVEVVGSFWNQTRIALMDRWGMNSYYCIKSTQPKDGNDKPSCGSTSYKAFGVDLSMDPTGRIYGVNNEGQIPFSKEDSEVITQALEARKTEQDKQDEASPLFTASAAVADIERNFSGQSVDESRAGKYIAGSLANEGSISHGIGKYNEGYGCTTTYDKETGETIKCSKRASNCWFGIPIVGLCKPDNFRYNEAQSKQLAPYLAARYNYEQAKQNCAKQKEQNKK